MNTKDMLTLPYTQTVNPFGKINVWYLPDGRKKIRAFLLMEHIRKGAQTGIGIEGSALLKSAFGFKGRLGPWLAQRSDPNLVSLTTQRIGSYLARKVDADRQTTIIYWATGPQGTGVQAVGDLAAFEVEGCDFAGPEVYGSAVNLLPAVRYFVERFVDASWGLYVFITQGKIQDLAAVKQYSTQLAQAIAAGQRNELKLVLIGVGQKIVQEQMAQLDDLVTGVGVDLWDYKIAAEMPSLNLPKLGPIFGWREWGEGKKAHFSLPVIELFTEVVDENTIVAASGRVLDAAGSVVLDHARGLPSVLEFVLAAGSTCFQLELADECITQPII